MVLVLVRVYDLIFVVDGRRVLCLIVDYFIDGFVEVKIKMLVVFMGKVLAD